MQLPYSDEISIEYLSRLFDNKSECYKLFWFQAIVNKVIAGKDILTFDELINEMIADSWYMVTEYKLNLGPKDNLEILVQYIYDVEQGRLKKNEKKASILSYLEQCQDKYVAEIKRKLKDNVPYRLQAPFFEHIKGKEWHVSERSIIEKINREKRLMYYFSELSGLRTKIYVQPEWCSYIIRNQEILKGWIQYNMIMYLQRRNPNVPGIVDKLNPPQERRLTKVIKYWKTVMNVMPVYDIYGKQLLTEDDISIDHFIPWSYVAHDEFWNLSPTTRSINSMKSNGIPKWDRYFKELSKLEYQAFMMMWDKDEFKQCKKGHINSDDVSTKLYREGIAEQEFCMMLENILLPVYKSAENVGFKTWEL